MARSRCRAFRKRHSQVDWTCRKLGMSYIQIPSDELPVEQFRRLEADLAIRKEFYRCVLIFNIRWLPFPYNTCILPCTSSPNQHDQQKQQGSHEVVSRHLFASASRNERPKSDDELIKPMLLLRTFKSNLSTDRSFSVVYGNAQTEVRVRRPEVGKGIKRRRNERMAHLDDFLQNLAIPLCVESFSPKEWKTLFSSRNNGGRLNLSAIAILLKVVRNRQNVARKAVFRPFWPNGERS